MADSYTHFGQAKDHIWGADAVCADYGEVQRVTRRGTGAWKDLKNRFGAVTGKTIYDQGDKISVTVLLKKNKQPPKQGDKISFDGKTWLVDEDVTVEQQNEDYQTLSVPLSFYKNMPNP